MTNENPWFVGLTSAAEADYHEILRWTAEHFGEAQAITYEETLDRAIDALMAGPGTMGVKTREDIAPGIFSQRVSRGNRRGRHL